MVDYLTSVESQCESIVSLSKKVQDLTKWKFQEKKTILEFNN